MSCGCWQAWAGQLSVAVRLCLGQQIAEAMAAIHERGVLHRDLATRNVLVHSLSADSAAEVWILPRLLTISSIFGDNYTQKPSPFPKVSPGITLEWHFFADPALGPGGAPSERGGA